MISGVRRALAGLAIGVVVSLGLAPALPSFADTPSPTPVSASATASAGATPSATASTGADIDAGDVAPDNSRQAWALGGAGVVALIAAAVVFLRRR